MTEPPLPEPIDHVAAVRRSIRAIRLPSAAGLADQTRDAYDIAAAAQHTPSLDDAWCDDGPPLDLLNAPDPHDAFFRVARHGGDALAAHHRGLLAALHTLDDEARTDAVPSYPAVALRMALQALRAPHALAPLDLALPAAADDATPRSLDDAVRRWVRGHQVFAVLTQGLVLAVRALQHAAQAAPPDALAHHLHRLADLYTATALAMRFTADFPREHYDQAIRPAMSEPHAPAGFSGALSSDHAVLVQQLMQARPALELAARLHPAEHRAVKAALAAMYDDHKHVCGRLAGLAGPSIRSAGLAHEQHAAGELLDRFRDRRAQLLR
jgi:hypothetical protein